MQTSRLVLAGMLMTLATTSSVLANRPGTPNGEGATRCNFLTEKPMVCVWFNNTATELVTFDIEFTVDGVKVDGKYEPGQGPAQGHRPQALPFQRPIEYHPRSCLGPQCVTGATLPNHLGDAISVFMNGHPDHWALGRTGVEGEFGSAIPPEGFRIVDLDYGVTYCFRFKARRQHDDMVSENWSNWACATTEAAPPAKPSRFSATARYVRGGVDWRKDPPYVVVTWTKSDLAGSYTVSGPGDMKYYRGDPSIAAQRSYEECLLCNKAEATLIGSDFENRLNEQANPSLVYTVCANNISGSTCAKASTFVRSAGEYVDPSPIPKGDLMLPNKPAQDTNRPVPTSLPTNADQVGRPDGGVETGIAGTGGQGRTLSTACASGYVWRGARDGDVVCVTPEARGRIAGENAVAAGLVNPQGAYGRNTCLAGLVWRDAFDGDVVCVTPEARALAHQENAEGPSHLADKGEVFRAPH